ncbi:MAG TPA: ABC transporter ATP-binding protein/permease [Candidatus Eisenbergiella merdavium]|uniref:ABC transporter ATP-binding protein/permease n=1 Tax=Candidatus Eisenbergiella merdavium TaxID=2838551 RepID=A0A9D2SSB3_9FIRM|nr:ABC transporter ATP-binding protein/permease [Candidatus Eisenbergiella merdavium]
MMNIVKKSVKTMLDGLSLLFHMKPGSIIGYIFGSILHGFSWSIEILCMQLLFDSVYDWAAGEEEITKVWINLLILGISFIFSQVMNGAFNCYGQNCNLRVSRYLSDLLFDKIKEIPLTAFEDTEQLEQIEKAVNGGRILFWVSTTVLDIIFYYGTYFFIVGSYMIQLNPVLGFTLLLIFLPCILSKSVNYLIFEKKENLAASERRRMVCYEDFLTGLHFFKETRLLGAGKYFQKLHINSLKKLGKIEWQAQVSKGVIELILSIVTAVCYGLLLYLLFNSVLNHSISLGAFAAILGSLGRLYGNMNEIVSERIGWASENVASAGNFLNFIQKTETENREKQIGNFHKIDLNNLSFSYPGSSEPVVKNVNLSIQRGETLAIVGANGSGKTTLCRLIMGLYIPTTGEIQYDNISSSEINYTDISSVFQKYCRYEMSLRKNIEISDPYTGNPYSYSEKAGRTAGVQISMDTVLGRKFHGIDLSGGQWQRVAIARGIYRKHSLLILDEPTAALDPLEESRIYHMFQKISENKTAVIVTHRLALSRIADRIIVMKAGKIIQCGTFNELVQEDGEYRKMYMEQLKW